MSSIGSIGSGGGGWSAVATQQRPQRPSKEELFKRADGDGSGGVDASELQQMLVNRPGATNSASGTASSTESSSAVDFSKLDGDGNGSLDATELDAAMKSLMPKPGSTMEFAQMRGMGGMDGPGGAGGPPPAGGGGGQGGAGSASSTDSASSSSTTYDPLDTNEDGVVSAQERAAGELKELMEQALKAADGNGDQSLSASEMSSLKDAVTQALDKATGASSSPSSSSSGSNQNGSGNSKLDEQAAKLVDWMLKQYAAGGGNGGNGGNGGGAAGAAGSQVNVSA